MLFDLIEVLTQPEAFVCTWRDGELFVEAIPDFQQECATGQNSMRIDNLAASAATESELPRI